MTPASQLPVVAIIGRPNVGKSTLFNRLTRTRRAIMEQTAGVTRDRLYGRAEWDGVFFDVVDTGGIDDSQTHVLTEAMRAQTTAAIEEADVLVVILDGPAGLTPVDHQILDEVRRTEKPTLYVVNKIDTELRDEMIYEFYEAGVDKLYPVSAEHGRGVPDLLEDLLPLLPRQLTAEDLAAAAAEIRLAVIGRPNVGKSSLINKILGADRLVVSEVPGTTRDVIDTAVETDDHRFILLDTAGIRRKSKTKEKLEKFTIVKALEALERADIALLVIDATRGIEEQDAKIAGYLQDAHRGAVVVVNKWDLGNEDFPKQKRFAKELRWKIKFLPFAPMVFTSARTGEGVDELLPAVAAAYAQYSRRIPTAKVNAVVEAAVERNPPPSPGGRHVRIRFATQVATRPPTFVVVVNRPEDIHVTYERFISNQLYEAFGFEGAPLKLRFRPPKGRWKAADKFGR